MPKGVTAQEKRDRMLAIFHRSPVTVYNYKEIEKESSKAGIVSGAIEGVLKELLGDNLVREDKISGAKFYWSFPGEQRTMKEADINQTQAATAQLARRVEELTAQVVHMVAAFGAFDAKAARRIAIASSALSSKRT